MPADQSSSLETEPSNCPPVLKWPWGQAGWFLAGLWLSFAGVEQLAVILGLIHPTIDGDFSPLQTVAVLSMIGAVACGGLALFFRVWRTLRQIPPPTHVAWLRKVNFGLLAIGLLSMMTALFIPAINAAQRAQQELIASRPWRENSFAAGAIRFSTHPTWEIVENPNSPASSIDMSDRKNDVSLRAMLVSKQDLAVQSLKELAQRSAAALAENLIDPKSGEMQAGEVDGLPTIDVVQTGTSTGVNLVWHTRLVECPDVWVELRMWTTRSRYVSHAETFDQIAASIRRGK